MQPMLVDLPAPLGPSNPKIVPGSAVKLTPSTATRSPYAFRRFSTSIMNARPGIVREIRLPPISSKTLHHDDYDALPRRSRRCYR
jgi:hypothetical protein